LDNTGFPFSTILFIQAGTIHAAKAVGSAKGVELATYLVLERAFEDIAPR